MYIQLHTSHVHVHISTCTYTHYWIPGCVFKESIVRAEHFVWHQIEPLSSQSPIVVARLSSKLDVEPAAKVAQGTHIADCTETIFKQIVPPNWQLQEIWSRRLCSGGKKEEGREKRNNWMKGTQVQILDMRTHWFLFCTHMQWKSHQITHVHVHVVNTCVHVHTCT